MPNFTKRDLLPLIDKKTLQKLAADYDVPVRSNAGHAVLVEALAGKRSVSLEGIIPAMSVNELRAACDYLGLARNGNKTELSERLLPTPVKNTAKTQAKQKPTAKANTKPSVKAKQTTNTKATPTTPKPFSKPETAKPITAPKRANNPMFEQAFKNIDDILHKDAGSSSELDYTEQTSWLLFLKYLDALEQDKAMEAELEGKPYNFILDKQYRWESWAAPKTKDGKIDHNKAMTGDDLKDFVDHKLFTYLKGFKQRATGPNTIEYKIGEIFGEIKNKIQSGYNLREVLEIIDGLRFRSQTEKHELSHLYEAKIKNMGNAGRNGGEYYTPRPLIRAMIQVTQPKIGQKIYDGAVGSAGFLCEAFDFLSSQPKLSTSDLKTLQEKTFYGKEKKSLAYVIAIMNMILHGIEAPNIIHTNTLAENLADVQDKDRFDIVLANPPFGGKERKEVQQNFPIKTGETAFLFLQHFIKMLKAGGQGAVVIKNTFLSNTDNASVSLRKLLLESCNLHTVLDCPGGTFQGAGVKTVVLFFEKGAPTRKVWYYQLDPGRNMGKTNPLNDNDLAEFIQLQKTFADSDKSWSVDIRTLSGVEGSGVEGSAAEGFDLSVKNPDGGEVIAHRSPEDIMEEIAALDAESTEVLANIRKML